MQPYSYLVTNVTSNSKWNFHCTIPHFLEVNSLAKQTCILEIGETQGKSARVGRPVIKFLAFTKAGLGESCPLILSRTEGEIAT